MTSARKLASRADRRLISAAHRPGYLALSSIAKIGKAVRVPGVGVVVSDGALIREVLMCQVAIGIDWFADSRIH